ncbi:MAG: hypothetical protein Q4G05_06595 [Clostridia bacterium]|nr:hypothetical protein [Clostridia bacterium]
MPGVREKITNLFNKIFGRNSTKKISNVPKQNYDEYRRTYDTLLEIFSELGGMNAYLIGGISVAIQTNQDLYRQNGDIDIMCKEEDLTRLIQVLQKNGYSVDDRRGIKTRNIVDSEGHFQARDHELNADTRKNNRLGVGIFTYQVKAKEVTTHSYAFEEKEGRIVGTEKVMPKELFDLMYDSRIIDYKGMKLKTQSKEYIYMTKSNGSREKDKLDASVIELSLDDKSKAMIARIEELNAKTRTYKVLYNKDGIVESRTKLPTFKEKVNAYLDSLFMKDTAKTPEQVMEEVLKSDEYRRIIVSHPEIDSLIEAWKERTKNYAYQDKIEMLTKYYSLQLERFSKATIDNAVIFLQRRRINHGRDNNDIELDDEAKKFFELMREYGQSIKKIFIDNNINITHITNVAPEKLENGELRKSLDRANNYETERSNGVFASSSPVDGNNPYIARNNSGMIRLDKFTYIYGSDNIDVSQDSEGKKHAVLKQPNYIYYINPKNFTPVCNLTINPYTQRPTFEFSEEWISDTAIDISDQTQIHGVDEVKDVTSLLEHFTILCDAKSQGIGIKARQFESREKALQYVTEEITNGSVRHINKEIGINVRNLSDPVKEY